jgi:hypothetical protein
MLSTGNAKNITAVCIIEVIPLMRTSNRQHT